MSKMTAFAFSKMTGIKDMYVRVAIEMYPPEGRETDTGRQIVYPREEIARSVRMYSKWEARKLKEQHRKRMEEIIEIAMRADEVLEDEERRKTERLKAEN